MRMPEQARGLSCPGIQGRYRMGLTGPSSVMPISTDFVTIKVKREFLVWLKMESARRGVFIYDLIEELAARGYAGKRVWNSRPAGSQPSEVHDDQH